MSKAATPKIGLRATAGKRTLRIGMVNLTLAMTPTRDDSARVGGKLVAPDTHASVKQVYVDAEGEIVKPAKVYPYGKELVELGPDDVQELEDDGMMELLANVPAADVADMVEKTNLAWPADATNDAAYGVVSHYLRHNGRAFLGRTIANGTHKVMALRWSDVFGCLVFQLLSYHEQVRWEKVETARAGVAAIAEPDDAMQTMADQLFATFPTTFEWESVEDTYGQRLAAAIEANATGTPAAATPAGQAPDLLAALKATLDLKSPGPDDLVQQDGGMVPYKEVGNG